MKIVLAIIASVVLGLGVFVGYTEVFTKTVRYDGSFVGAIASAFEFHDGTEVSVYLSADDSTSKENGVMTESSSLWLDVYYTEIGDPDNYEDDVYRNFSGYVDLQPGDFVVSDKFSGAQLDVQNAQLCEWVNDWDGSDPIPPEPDCMTTNISAVWNNAGYTETSGGTSYYRGQYCSTNDRYSNKSRSADAQIEIVDSDGNQIFSGPTDPMSAWIYSSDWKGKTRGCDYSCITESAGAPTEIRSAHQTNARTAAGLKPAAGGGC